MGRSVPNQMVLQTPELEKQVFRIDSAEVYDNYSEPGLTSAVRARFPRTRYSIRSVKPRDHQPCPQGDVVEVRWDDILALPAVVLAVVRSMYSVEVVEGRNGVKRAGGNILDEECSSGCDARPESELGILPDEEVEEAVQHRGHAVNCSMPDTVVEGEAGVDNLAADEAAD